MPNRNRSTLRGLQNQFSELCRRISANTKWSARQVSQFINACLATDFAVSTDRYLRDIFETAPTAYYKAMDAWREVSGHLGFDHRVFDGGHGPVDAWQAVKDALPDDSFKQEIIGFLQAYWKDLVTPMGMPIASLNKENFEWAADVASNIGIEKGWLLDLVSFTATEGVGALAALIGASLNWKKADIEQFAEYAASIGMSSAQVANPLALTVAVLLMARSYHVGKREGGLSRIYKQFDWGAGKSAAFIGAAGLVGGSAWIGIVAGVAAAVAVHKIKERYTPDDEVYATDYMAEKMTNHLQPKVLMLADKRTP